MTVNKMTSEVEGSRKTKSPLEWERVAVFHKQPEKACPGAQVLVDRKMKESAVYRMGHQFENHQDK